MMAQGGREQMSKENQRAKRWLNEDDRLIKLSEILDSVEYRKVIPYELMSPINAMRTIIDELKREREESIIIPIQAIRDGTQVKIHYNNLLNHFLCTLSVQYHLQTALNRNLYRLEETETEIIINELKTEFINSIDLEIKKYKEGRENK